MGSDGKVSYREYINIDIGTPKLVNIDQPHEKYVIYETTVKTNSLSFAAPYTRVCRRYRDFVWLYSRLRSIPHRTANVPSLPGRQFFWNDDATFLHKRRKALEAFLRRVVGETIFLSSSSLHLFLQTDLTPSEMEECINDGRVEQVMNTGVKTVKVNESFTDSLGSSNEVERDTKSDEESSNIDSVDADDRHSPIFWNCEKSTMRKVASLPNFSPVLKNFDVENQSKIESNNNTAIQIISTKD